MRQSDTIARTNLEEIFFHFSIFFFLYRFSEILSVYTLRQNIFNRLKVNREAEFSNKYKEKLKMEPI